MALNELLWFNSITRSTFIPVVLNRISSIYRTVFTCVVHITQLLVRSSLIQFDSSATVWGATIGIKAVLFDSRLHYEWNRTSSNWFENVWACYKINFIERTWSQLKATQGRIHYLLNTVHKYYRYIHKCIYRTYPRIAWEIKIYGTSTCYPLAMIRPINGKQSITLFSLYVKYPITHRNILQLTALFHIARDSVVS